MLPIWFVQCPNRRCRRHFKGQNPCSVMSAVAAAAGKYKTHQNLDELVTVLVVIYVWIAPICPDSVDTVNFKTQNSPDMLPIFQSLYTSERERKPFTFDLSGVVSAQTTEGRKECGGKGCCLLHCVFEPQSG